MNIKDKLLSIKYSQLIKDPYIEYSQEEQSSHSLKIFGFEIKAHSDLPKISIWKAHREGCEKAYEEIIAAIGHREWVDSE